MVYFMNRRRVLPHNAVDEKTVMLLRHLARQDTFMRDSDRSTVIVGAAWLDELLHSILKAKLLPPVSGKGLLEGDGALGTFSARIELAYRLGLIDAQFARSLDLVRKTRNLFAHEFEAGSLNNEPHASRVRELVKPFAAYSNYATFETRVSLYKRHTGAAADFRVVVSILAMGLQGLALRVTRLHPTPATPIPSGWLRPKKA